MAAIPPLCDFGWKAPSFNLPGVDGKTHALENLRGPTARSSFSSATIAPM